MSQPSTPLRHESAASSIHSAPGTPLSRLMLLAGSAFIAVVTLLVYLPSVNGQFILDDDVLVTGNPLIKSSDGLYRIWLTTEPFDYWPLTNTSFWIEWRLWGMNPTGYHVTNLMLHIASALLIWTILRRLSIPGAFLAALLFAVHPVNVESVAWIAQRKNTLSMLFFLLSILWYLKAAHGLGRWYWLSLLAFVLAMLSKGSVAVLPVVLLLLAWWQRGSVSKRDLARIAPFFVVAIALAAVNVWFQTHGEDVEVRSAGFAERLAGAGGVVWFYLYKALVPLNLVFVYPQRNIDVSDWRWWAPLIAAVSVTALLLWQRHPRFPGTPGLLFAWLFFCVALAPVMGFTDVGFMRYSLVADRYLYVPVIAVVSLVAAAATLSYQDTRGNVRHTVSIAVTVVVGWLMYLSWQQSRMYRDPLTLYLTTVSRNPDSSFVHNNLGIALDNAGNHSEATIHFERAVALDRSNAMAHYNVGNSRRQAGLLEEAMEQYQQAVRLEPRFFQAYNNLAGVLLDSGRFSDAIPFCEHSLRLKPDYVEAHFNLGRALAQAGNIAQAIEHYWRAVELQPDYPEAHNNLGLMLFSSGRLPEAIEHYRQAVHLKPEFPQAHFNLGNALASSGQLPEAIEHFQLALRLNPDFAEAHGNLGIALAQSDRLPEAIEHYQRAVQLKPDYQECYGNLARAYAKLNRSQEAIATAHKALELARAAGRVDKVQQMENWLNSYQASLKSRRNASPRPDATPPSP